jgi:HPt (histidine-containing phosphotransfer) domain-containing protein
MTRGLASGDLTLLERAAHTLKSSSANLGAIGLSDLCLEIERRARGGSSDGVEPLVLASQKTFHRVETALREIES